MKLNRNELLRLALTIAAVALVVTLLYLYGERLGRGLLRWFVIAAYGGFGYAVGWFLSPNARTARRAILLSIGAFALFIVLVADRWSASSLTYMLSITAFVLGVGYWIGSVLHDLTEKPTTFGSAEWATATYLHDRQLLGSGGLQIGSFENGNGGQRLRYTGDRHLLTVAPTRSGKGTTAIIPNLLTYRASALIVDPKGENALITADQRRALGHAVHIVDPWSIAPQASDRPARFNPLDWLVDGDIDITENAMLLADALVVPEGDGDRFWIEEAKALLQGLILYVATDEYERADRTLGRVRDLLLLDGEEMPALFSRMVDSPHHIVASTGARCLQKEEKLLANVIASAQAQTHFLDSARIRESLSASDFKFEDLKSTAMTIYLVLPSDRLNAFGRWLRLLIQQAITVNARNIDVKPAQPVLFLLDEMPALGRLSMVEQAFGLMAGFGMQLWGIVQDVAQLKRIYGDGWETFIGNSGVVQYFGSRDRMTADYFSALCGVTTVWNLSTAIGRVFGAKSSSSSTTNTSTAAQRKLAYPDELMRLPSDRSLVLIENHHPIMGAKIGWFDDPALKALGRNLFVKETNNGAATAARAILSEGVAA